MHSARSTACPASCLSLEPATNGRRRLLNQTRDLSQLQTFYVIVKQQQRLVIVERSQGMIQGRKGRRSETLTHYVCKHHIIACSCVGAPSLSFARFFSAC